MKRVATAVALIPVITYVVIWAPFAVFAAVLAATATLCYIEYGGIVAAHGIPRPGWIGIAGGLLVLLAPGDAAFLIAATALIGMALALGLSDLRQELPRAAALTLGIAYAYATWRSAIPLRAVSPYWLFLAIALNWVGDSAAYYAGRAFGRRKLAPRISPGKTWEGAAASVAGSLIFGVVFAHYTLPAAPLYFAAAVAALSNMAGQIGDLCESAIKRGAGLKDSGTLLPGHGGWLDRVDSTMFAVPAAYGMIAAGRALGIAGV